MADVGRDAIDIDFNQHDINKERREEDDEAFENLLNREEESNLLTNLNQGARPKTRNYEQMLSEQNREDVRK